MKIALTFFRKSSKIMTTQLTAPIYYYDSNGYKIGPVRKRDIIALAERGEITPETRITDNNIEVKAKNIPKLKFYAPEFHRAEEIFDPKNIDYNSIPQTAYLKPKETINSSSTNSPQTESQIDSNAPKLTQLDITTAAINVLGIIAVICFFAFDMPSKLGIIPKFNPPEMKIELPRFEVPQPLIDNTEEKILKRSHELADKFKVLTNIPTGDPAGLNFQVNIPTEELQRGVRVPERNAPPPPRPNR